MLKTISTRNFRSDSFSHNLDKTEDKFIKTLNKF